MCTLRRLLSDRRWGIIRKLIATNSGSCWFTQTIYLAQLHLTHDYCAYTSLKMNVQSYRNASIVIFDSELTNKTKKSWQKCVSYGMNSLFTGPIKLKWDFDVKILWIFWTCLFWNVQRKCTSVFFSIEIYRVCRNYEASFKVRN